MATLPATGSLILTDTMSFQGPVGNTGAKGARGPAGPPVSQLLCVSVSLLHFQQPS